MNVTSRSLKEKDSNFGFLITLPAIVMLLVLFAFPIVYSLWLSFTDYNFILSRSLNFIGLDNYLSLFRNSDFLNSMKVTLEITFFALFFEFLLGLLIANFMTKVVTGRDILKATLLIPMMLSPTFAGMLFRFILNNEFGILNSLLYNSGIITRHIGWLTNGDIATISIVITDSWTTIPFVFLLLYTSLSDIPETLIEAGRIDGASGWQIFARIQLPLIKRTALLALFIRFMDVFRIFDSIYVMTKGGPGKSTESLSLLIYRINWLKNDLGYASSLSYAMMIIMFVIALIINWFSKDREERMLFNNMKRVNV